MMRELITISNCCCCQALEIFCPCSTSELEYVVKFLYHGQIDCNAETDYVKILNTLKNTFGFPRTFHEDCFKDFGSAKTKKRFPSNGDKDKNKSKTMSNVKKRLPKL